MKYTLIKKTCPICKIEFSTKLGHRKEKTCCTRECGNVFFARKKSDEVKSKIRNTLLTRFSTVEKSVEKSKGKYKFICRSCTKEFHSRTPNRKCCSKKCLSTDATFKSGSYDRIKDRINKGLHKGWKKRSTNIPSYPEKFFMGVLDSRNIKYKFDLPCGKWWIDFAIVDKNVALEIDGKQHEKEARKKLDLKKDADLSTNGWKVYRIKWKSINTESGKRYIEEEIRKFEQFLSA